MHVSTSSFDAQLAALRRLYRVVPMQELRAILAGRTPLTSPVAVVTFDDGYRDNYQQALPILARHGVPATFFLSWDFVERRETFWFDRVADAARAWDTDAAARRRLEAILPPAVQAALASAGDLSARLRRATAYLKTLPDAEREAIVTRLAAPAAGAVPPHSEPLRWDEVQALRAAGMHIGAHGVRHGILTRMPEPDAAAEIGGSMQAIAARVGTAVEEFAYPNGDADDSVAQVAATAGVQLGFTMRHDAVRLGDDPLRLARRNVCEATSQAANGRFSEAYFWCEITGWFDLLLGRNRRA
jgi:peptidoglycan/xylan/chitin deacetylase (PgdA/CDA1 family)